MKLWHLLPLLVCLGCGTKRDAPVRVEPSPEPLTIVGPHGEFALGVTAAAAKEAFPPPSGAEEFDRTQALETVSLDGWGWGIGDGTGFEVALEDDLVVAAIYSELDGPLTQERFLELTNPYGTPSQMATSENVAVLAWESGTNARVFVHFKREVPRFGVGFIVVAGDKARLRDMGYTADDPGTYVALIDSTIATLESGQGAGE